MKMRQGVATAGGTAAMRKAVALPLALLMMGVAALAQPQWKGAVVKEGDVTVVKNPKEPLYKTPVFELKEELSIGGPEAQEDAAFGQIASVAIDDAGTLYVLDARASNIKIFDASGEYLRTVGRQGQGPGELEYPTNLSLIRTKGELAVNLQTRGIVFFKTDGTFLRQLSLKGLITGRGRLDSRGQIYILEIAMGENDSRYVTKKLAPDASVLATISETQAPAGKMGTNKIKAFLPVAYFVVDRDDRFVYGYPATYEIQLYGPAETKMLRKITREYDAVPITSEERGDLEKGIPPGMKVEIEYPKDHPAFTRFFLSDRGHLFVQTYEKAANGMFVHDVFDAEGRFIGRLPLKPSGLEILNGKYYALEEDEEGYQYVKRYAVNWLVK
jgi:hypothetical protein